MSAFDAYAAAFASPLREAWLGDSAPVVLRMSGGQPIATLTAILFEVRQEIPELETLAEGVSERNSRETREVEFQHETLRAHNGVVVIGMLCVIDNVPWAIRRIVSDTDASIRVECSRKVKHERAKASIGGGAR